MHKQINGIAPRWPRESFNLFNSGRQKFSDRTKEKMLFCVQVLPRRKNSPLKSAWKRQQTRTRLANVMSLLEGKDLRYSDRGRKRASVFRLSSESLVRD